MEKTEPYHKEFILIGLTFILFFVIHYYSIPNSS